MLLQVPRVPMGVQDLVIGAECGGSDYTSGLAGNVVVGRLYDRLVDLGGTAIFERDRGSNRSGSSADTESSR